MWVMEKEKGRGNIQMSIWVHWVDDGSIHVTKNRFGWDDNMFHLVHVEFDLLEGYIQQDI